MDFKFPKCIKIKYFQWVLGHSKTRIPGPSSELHGLAVAFATQLYLTPNLTLNLPTTTIVAQPFNVIKWQLKFNPVA